MAVPVLTAAAMRQADQTAIESFGITGFTLMESAGRAAADIVAEILAETDRDSALILCGKGNNGGDGLVVARQLAGLGYAITVVMLGARDELSQDARTNLDLLTRLIEKSTSAHSAFTSLFASGVDATIIDLETWVSAGRPDTFDLIVDAMLGTGLTSDLREPIRGVVDWMNEQGKAVIAIDIPTGLDTDRGVALGNAVRADLTVTMGALKVGLLMNDGPEYCGDVEVVEIGIPGFALEDASSEPGCAIMVDDRDVSSWLPKRDHSSHKYNTGMVLATVGSRAYTGAAVMSTLSAYRSGAGYVVAGVPVGIKETLAETLVEVPLEPLAETVDGGIASTALSTLQDRIEKAGALLVGCGLGREEETLEFVRNLVGSAERPGVVDADGLYALAGHLDLLKKPAGAEWILTPHWGEFVRLVGNTSMDQTDAVKLASEYAVRWGCVLLLKGLPSVVGCPDGRVYINQTGNPGLATAGTGDVLAGLCAGLLAQGLSPEHAAIAGLHVGGAAADLFAELGDPRSMMATDLIELLPEVMMRF